MVSPLDSTGFWIGVTGAISALVGFLTSQLSGMREKSKVAADAQSTLGEGWSTFADALRAEAREEREARLATEQEAQQCLHRLQTLERKCDKFEAHLRSLGIPIPPDEA